MIHGIHHVALKCRGEAEFEKTVAFYRDLLGMPVVRSWGAGTGRGIMLDCGGGHNPGCDTVSGAHRLLQRPRRRDDRVLL